ncbi:MAG: primosomal protein N' [Amoebophilaceae bacterium]|jgi:primosomal protein N' (replication factor Y)|nr:primosomal protein N' [Amoebophilaceae bacterium]
MSRKATFADIILPIPLSGLLTYRVPEMFIEFIAGGSRVLVPLGTQKVFTGLVEKIHTTPPNHLTKDIIDVLDHVPIVNAMQLRFIHWLASYYLCTVGEVMLAALPNGFRLSSQSKIQLHPEADLKATHLSEQERLLVNALERRKNLTYTEAAAVVVHKNVHHLIQSLLHKQIVLLFEEIKEKYTPKKVKRVRLNEAYTQSREALQGLFAACEQSGKQLDVLLKYAALAPVHQPARPEDLFVDKKEFSQSGLSASALQTLIKKQIFVEEESIVSRFGQVRSPGQSPPTLSQAQSEALATIHRLFQEKNTVLLHGVTASGKTAVYTQLIQEVLQSGGQVLYLLPEIALTTQMVKRLKIIFCNQIGVYHSRYSDNERVEVWNSVLQGECSFVLGTRSAIFLPFDQLSLIIIDEEHETSYKQFDVMPRYHARDAALFLAQLHHAKVLLGSATPSIESYYHAQSGKYGFVALRERFGRTALPEIALVNMRIERERKTLREDFSKALLEALQQTLDQQEQAIIFQNRRGYAPYMTCETCSWVPMCTQCAVSLTYHQFHNALRCHYCGYKTQVPLACNVCGSPQLKKVGFGTEKLEETLRLFFPAKKIQRMDLDTTRGKHSYDKIIDALEQGSTDILVGTQMITKGLDFGKVSLVGVLDVDRLLYFPDFRASERCFQLLTQVSGRAGRREKRGTVIIQTNNPQHPVLQDILQHDYERMYRRELQERKQFLYPPYARLVRITLKHRDKDLVASAAHMLASILQKHLEDGVLGPQMPLIAKVKNQYLIDIWVKIKKGVGNKLLTTKQVIVQETRSVLYQKNFKQVKVSFDVDPV